MAAIEVCTRLVSRSNEVAKVDRGKVPAAVEPRGDRPIPKGQGPQDRGRSLLVVRCGRGKKQTLHHLFTECRAWMPQIRRLWRDIGKAHGWKHPRAPLGKWLGKGKSTEVVLAFLGGTRVGCISARRAPPEEVQGADFGDEGEESGPGPPVLYVYFVRFLLSLVWRPQGAGDRGALLGLIILIWDSIWLF